MITIYEYYDGYDHLWEDQDEQDRMKVQYFVLGEIKPHWVAICYYMNEPFLAIIGKRTHKKAWTTTSITINEAKETLAKSYQKYKPTLDDYRKKYQELKNKTGGDPPSYPISGSQYSSFWGVSIQYTCKDTYYDSYAEEINKMIKLYELREEFLK